MSKLDLPCVLHNDKRGLLSIEDDKLDVLQLSADGQPPSRLLSCPIRLVLRARIAPAEADKPRRLELFALRQKSAKTTSLTLRKIHVLIEPTHHADGDEWVAALMDKAYAVTKPFRRVLLIVNPVGGRGKAVTMVNDQVMPLLEAAGCKVELMVTKHAGHAEEITRAMDIESFDVIASASGDGTLYEILNGLGARPDGRRALRVPIAPIPTGSACAACTNIFGSKDTFNMALAALNVIKGQPFPIDLCSVMLLPSRERRISFLSTALGLMVDADIGTEHLRWMGDTRFMYGFLRGVVANKPCKARLRLDVVSDDKLEMARVAREAAARESPKVVGGGTNPLELIHGVQKEPVSANGNVMTAAETNGGEEGANGNGPEEEDGELPPPRLLEPDDNWVTIESNDSKGTGQVIPGEKNGGWKDGQGFLFFYAGLQPWVSRDLNQFPVVRPGSGVIDIAIQARVPRKVLLSGVDGAAHGSTFWYDAQHYYKVRGFVVENLDKANQPAFTIDGEAFPWDSFHVEALPRAATMLSLDGRFYHSSFVTSSTVGLTGKNAKYSSQSVAKK